MHISKTKLAMAMKFRGWLQLGVRLTYLATTCRSCSTMPSTFSGSIVVTVATLTPYQMTKVYLITRRQILDSSKVKDFADDNFNLTKIESYQNG